MFGAAPGKGRGGGGGGKEREGEGEGGRRGGRRGGEFGTRKGHVPSSFGEGGMLGGGGGSGGRERGSERGVTGTDIQADKDRHMTRFVSNATARATLTDSNARGCTVKDETDLQLQRAVATVLGYLLLCQYLQCCVLPDGAASSEDSA